MVSLPSLCLGMLASLAMFVLAVPAHAKPATEPAPVASRLMVKASAQAEPGALRRALARAGATQVAVVPALGVRIVQTPVADRARALRSLRRAAAVAYAEPDGLTPPAEIIPNDALWVNQWSQPKTRTDLAWSATTGSAAVKVAILDSGVDPNQPDLAGNLLPGRDFYNNDSDPDDDYGHGTQVAGVAAGRSGNGIGVAGYCGGCSILPVKITGSNGYASWSAMASGITWAADQGARVINLSFAGTSGSVTVRDAIAYAHDRGAIVTVSAGNYGSNSAYYPAAYPGALAVAATRADDSLESYSNYGSWVQLAAPGCNYGTGRTTSSSLFANFCGTSSAAPAAAGIAALAASYAPTATNGQIESALESSAAPVGGFVRYGRVDAWATLAALGAGQPAAAAPLNSGAPVVLASNVGPLGGAPQPGQYLWTSGGGWSGAAGTALAFQWRRCDPSGGDCTAIPGAVSRTYSPTSSDSGYTLRSTVTATNPLGSASAVSSPTPLVGGTTTGSTPEAPSPSAEATTTTFSGSISARQPSKSFSLSVGGGDTGATLSFTKASALTLTLLAADGATLGAASGPSAVTLTRTLPAGTYRYVVSGKVAKGSASFSVTVRHPAP
jgi:subtilase family protein/fervidolysin-like protein